jgi:hypothetical protein
MAVFRQALQAAKDNGPLKQWQVVALQVAAEAHLEHIHAHHQNEDHLFGPEFEKRFQFQTQVRLKSSQAFGGLCVPYEAVYAETRRY